MPRKFQNRLEFSPLNHVIMAIKLRTGNKIRLICLLNWQITKRHWGVISRASRKATETASEIDQGVELRNCILIWLQAAVCCCFRLDCRCHSRFKCVENLKWSMFAACCTRTRIITHNCPLPLTLLLCGSCTCICSCCCAWYLPPIKCIHTCKNIWKRIANEFL